MRKFLIVAALLAFTTPTKAESYFMRGAGAQTCAKFAEAYARSPDMMENFYFSWVEGYISGVNVMYDGKHYFDMGAVPISTQQLTIRQFCDAHPLASFHEAAAAVLKTLPMLENK